MSRDDLGCVLLFGGIAGAILALISWGIYADNQNAKEWARFVAANQCRVTQSMPGETFNTFSFGTNGQPSIGVGSTSAKEAWQCSNGVTYWRNK